MQKTNKVTNLDGFIEWVKELHASLHYPSLEFSYIAYQKDGNFTYPEQVEATSSAVTTKTNFTAPMMAEMVKMLSDGWVLVWGHSHNWMGVQPSSQDIRQMQEEKIGIISNNEGDVTIMFNRHNKIVKYTIKETDGERRTEILGLKPTYSRTQRARAHQDNQFYNQPPYGDINTNPNYDDWRYYPDDWGL